MRQVTAREIMSSPVVTAGPDTPVRELANLMLRFRVSGLPVVDDDRRVLGVVSEADLLQKEEEPLPDPPLLAWHGRSLRLERMFTRYRKATGTVARDIMTENIVSATEETKAHELAHLMLRHNINRVLILRDGRLAGIVTRADVLKVFLRSDESILQTVRDTLARELYIDPATLTLTSAGGIVTIAGTVDRHSDRAIMLKWIRSVDGVVAVHADDLAYRVDDLALGRVAL
ncbi:MAG TPA: CBS domain-containing protein [bacterium]|nr:CBS domain-containing protein [bacterium]